MNERGFFIPGGVRGEKLQNERKGEKVWYLYVIIPTLDEFDLQNTLSQVLASVVVGGFLLLPWVH